MSETRDRPFGKCHAFDLNALQVPTAWNHADV